MLIFIKHIIITIMIFIIMAAWIIKQERDIQFLRLSMHSYKIANGKNVGVIRCKIQNEMYKKIADDYFLPVEFVESIQIHENINDGFSFGVKKLPLKIIDYFNPNEWQARGACYIAQQVLSDFVFNNTINARAYFNLLGKRYCSKSKNWGNDTYIIFENLKGDNQ